MHDPSCPCPCLSGLSYLKCCRPYHRGQPVKHAWQLMRSRFSAYALGLTQYIIDTTHPQNSHYNFNLKQWKKELIEFSKNVKFENLEILDQKELDAKACVVFIATLKQGLQDATFTERSYFQKLKKQWLYHSGDIFSGRKVDLKAQL